MNHNTSFDDWADFKLLRTTDAGATWKVDSSFANPAENIAALYFDEMGRGWAVGTFGAIYTNGDEGSTTVFRDVSRYRPQPSPAARTEVCDLLGRQRHVSIASAGACCCPSGIYVLRKDAEKQRAPRFIATMLR
jgi:photosystem II stability/assembly factor-like uncharacterized protein